MALTNRFQEMLIEKARRDRKPITVNLELLPVCNLNCRMCYIRTSMAQVEQNGGLKSVEEWLEFAEQLKGAGVLFLLLTGGEVFLYPDFKKLYIALYRMGFVITINTNATLIDESVIEWLEMYPPKCISISLYGASDETYEKLCGTKGMHTRVCKAVELLASRHIRFEFKTVFSPLNIQDMSECCAYTRSKCAFHETAFYAFPPARKTEKDDQIRFSPKEVVKSLFERNRLLSDNKRFVDNIVAYLNSYEQSRGERCSDLYGFTCSASNSSCWITWKGEMTPCALIPYPSTFPFEIGFLEAWEKLKEVCDQIRMSPQCTQCDKRHMCGVCPAANLAETGSYELASPFHCEMAEYKLEEMNRMIHEWGIEERIIRGEKKA